jgi:hypothetical protein
MPKKMGTKRSWRTDDVEFVRLFKHCYECSKILTLIDQFSSYLPKYFRPNFHFDELFLKIKAKLVVRFPSLSTSGSIILIWKFPYLPSEDYNAEKKLAHYFLI